MADPYQVAGHIRASLAAIADHYDEALGATLHSDHDTHHKRAQAPVPVSAHILDLRAEAHHDLRYYALFILEQVNHGTITGHVNGNDVRDLARFIDTWALALAEQHPADATDARKDLAHHAQALDHIANGDYTRIFHIPGGTCPETIPAPCTGRLVAVMRQGDVLLPRFIGCDIHPEHRWPPSQWLALGRSLTA